MNERPTREGASETAAMVAATAAAAESKPSSQRSQGAWPQRPFRPAGTLFTPAGSLALALGFLGGGACIAPWIARGWLWLALIGGAFALVTCYDAFALWLERKELTPVLMLPEKGLRGAEGQSIELPLAVSAPRRGRLLGEVRLALMPPTTESETAMRVSDGPQRMKLEQPSLPNGSAQASPEAALLWPWTPTIALLRRGLWPGPRVGIERLSRFGIWRLRQWFDSPAPLRIESDLRLGRRAILSSPVYRALVASRQTPWTGHGRDFERLREYQPGDNYSEISWRSTARRGAPVTRLFQWEQKQEIYFVVDQSRASAQLVDAPKDRERDVRGSRARRMLDLAVETALVGATVALELGDEFGLVTYADEPKSWLHAGNGQIQFHKFRDQLVNLEPLPTTADYEALFGEIRLKLRRRAYLVLLTDLAERSVADSLRRCTGLLRSSHIVLITSILPPHARPAFSPGEQVHSDQDVYAALTGEKENQRLRALSQQLRLLDVRLQFVPPERFLRSAVEGYLESKREQRL